MNRFVMVLLLLSLALGIAGGVSAQAESANEEIARKFVEAQRARQTGRNDEAIRIYRELLEAYPDRQDVANALGRILVQDGMFEEAVEFLTAALVRWPDYYHFIELLGQAYLELGQREKAVEIWHSVLTDREKDVSRYLQVSRAEWNAGMFEQAIATLKEARKFPRHYARFTSEIVRMEKTRGNLTEREETSLAQAVSELQRAFAVRAEQAQESALRQQGVDPSNIEGIPPR